MDKPLLQVERLQKCFNGETLLDNISFTLHEGEILGLIGQNGAGKSLLMKHLSGQIMPDSGTIRINGKPVSLRTPVDARKAGIASLSQNINLVDELSVAENIMLGALPQKFGRVDWNRVYAEANTMLEMIGLAIDSRTTVGELHYLQRRLVELAKVLYQKSPIILLDEPYLGFTQSEQAVFAEVLEILKKQQIGIILISHFIPQVLSLCDTVMVMHKGRISQPMSTDVISEGQLIESAMGSRALAQYPKLPLKIGRNLLEVRNLSSTSGLHNISFQLHRHEILGIWGMQDSRKEHLGRILYGIEPPLNGEIMLDGQKFAAVTSEAAIRLGIGYPPLEGEVRDIFDNMVVSRNISISKLADIAQMGKINARMEQTATESIMEHLYMHSSLNQASPSELSGGEQQKLRLARRLFSDSRILIMEEPTYSVDISSSMDIYTYMCNYVVDDRALILVSSNLPDMIGLCDRILIMHAGGLVADVPRKNGEFDMDRIRELIKQDMDL